MKKLLLLGGSAQQVVAIEKAKRLGYYTVLCDYLPDNPGQYAADAFYLVSTTDKDAVLQVARKENVDGVLAYASDPAAPTAAYVAEMMGLPTNPCASVEILSNKDLFRRFLGEHGFCTPYAEGFDDLASAQSARARFRLPVLVKPVDSSGSKGITRLDDWNALKASFQTAMRFSRTGRVIIEEFVEKFGYQIAGDGLAIDGKLVFRCFANDHFDPLSPNPFVPISASFPYNMPAAVQNKIHNEIQRLLTLLNMRTSCYNFDIRIDSDYNVYLMEVAPRDGGNYIPQVIFYATGVDLVECAIRAAIGETPDLSAGRDFQGFWSYYAVHSAEEGILKEIRIREDVRANNIVEEHIVKNPGDHVDRFTGANTALGILLMRFSSMEEMLTMMDNSLTWIKVVLQKED